MNNTFGKNIGISIFGESHGAGIGVVIGGLPAGIELDFKQIEKEMERRAPGRDKLSTARKESDLPIIQSGIWENHTTGAPLCALIKNSDTHSKDYSILKTNMRPGHADYTGNIRYAGFNDYRGGGHFSGRITAPLVFAGAVAKQILDKKGITIGAHISQIASIKDTKFDSQSVSSDDFGVLLKKELPVIDDSKIENMRAKILNAKADGDSVGGKIECAVVGIPAGLGNPFFDSVESIIAHLAFSVPAVKGIDFGAGDKFAEFYGSEANDEFYIKDGVVATKTNNNGGILGGITNGSPIIFEVIIKPTPSIAKEQDTVNIETKEEVKLQIKGRHDPCIVQRAVVVIEAIAAIAILELLNE
ncbi:chorismate synthase [Candidatus Epulonipiscium viviparus]|uniref:chorismate synthase n=1 Tax=Candidatus Epulonipiscium viviparus TaxID=420336 RepID=UPI000495AA32|nr:chorismate synthase [Candidatus Epulopiscium viviparus]